MLRFYMFYLDEVVLQYIECVIVYLFQEWNGSEYVYKIKFKQSPATSGRLVFGATGRNKQGWPDWLQLTTSFDI